MSWLTPKSYIYIYYTCRESNIILSYIIIIYIISYHVHHIFAGSYHNMMPPDPSLGETGQDHRGAAARLSVLGGLGRRGHGGFFKENFERWVWPKTLGKLGKCWEQLKKTWHIRTCFDAFIIQWKGSRENLIAVETMAFLWTRLGVYCKLPHSFWEWIIWLLWPNIGIWFSRVDVPECWYMEV